MSAEPIDIEVKDRISGTVRDKLLKIAQAALEGANSVDKLINKLKQLDSNSVKKLTDAQASLATQAAKTNLVYLQQETALNRAVQAEARALASTEKLAQAQAQTAATISKAQASSTQAAIATQRLAAAQAGAAAAQTRAGAASTASATAAQRLAAATAQAEAAQTRAAAAALRLQVAQDRAAKGVSSVTGLLTKLAAVTGTAFSIVGIVKLGDAYTTLQNKLQNVADSQGQVETLTNRLFELANKTRAPVEETATAFTRFDRALKSLGKSQEDSLRLTETVNKALVVGGATATEASSALLQLSQAFNAGKLQGDEFRSLAENMPVVLDAVAEATKTPINQVKKLATEGKITSEVLFKAFKLIEGRIDATFAKTIPTVSQALVVLRNNALQAFGQFDKASGLTQWLAKALLFLANNMSAVAVAAAAMSAALLVAFAPAIIGGVAAAGVAIAGILSPLVLVTAAVVGVTAAIYTFGDSFSFAADKSYTLKDIGRAVFAEIGDAASKAGDYIKAAFDSDAASSVGKFFSEFATTSAKVFSDVVGYAKTAVNKVIGFFTGAGLAIGYVFNNFPAVVELAYKSIVNTTATVVESVVNIWQYGFRKIAELLQKVAPDVAGEITKALDSVTLKLPRLELGESAKTAAAELSKTFKDALDKDYIGDAAGAIVARAKKISAKRAMDADKASYGEAALRKAGKNTNVAEPDKNAEKRSLYIAKITAELNKQISSYGQLESVRAVQEKLDEYDIQLASKKLAKLSTGANGEREALKLKLEQIEVNKKVQASQDAIYNEIQGPQEKYKNDLKAIDNLLKINAISQDQYNDSIARTKASFEDSSQPMAAYTRNFEQQNALLNVGAKEREILAQQFALENANRTAVVKLTEQEIKTITEQNIVLQKRNEFMQAYDAIIAANTGAQQQLVTQLNALNTAYAQGRLSQDQYSQGFVQIGLAMNQLLLDKGAGFATFENVALGAIGRIVEGYKNALAGLSETFGTFFTTLTDGFANSIGRAIVYGQNLKDSLLDVARQGVAELISGLVKLGIQYVINAALGRTIAASSLVATTAASAAAAATIAAAWAPAAAAVSLASYGANAIPAAEGIALNYALTQALSKVTGFQAGGYTGDVPQGQIAGVVHGQEYVMNAAATKANRGTLEAMNSGTSVGNSGSLRVVIEDHGTPKTYETVSITKNEVRLIARDEVNARAPDAVAGAVNNPNSKVSKSIQNNFEVSRNRSN